MVWGPHIPLPARCPLPGASDLLSLGWVMDLSESMCICVPGRLLGPVTSVLWRIAVGGRETSSSWPCGWGFAGVTRTWLTSWTLAEPLQPEFWFFSHTEGPAPSDGSRRQPRVQLWGHPGERAWPVSLHFWLAWACGAQPMFQPPYPSPHPSPPVLRVPGEVTPTILSPLSASWVYQCHPQDSTRPQRDVPATDSRVAMGEPGRGALGWRGTLRSLEAIVVSTDGVWAHRAACPLPPRQLSCCSFLSGLVFQTICLM